MRENSRRGAAELGVLLLLLLRLEACPLTRGEREEERKGKTGARSLEVLASIGTYKNPGRVRPVAGEEGGEDVQEEVE